MFSFSEMLGQSSRLHKTGTVEITANYHVAKRPAWLVLVKLLCVGAMIAVGAAIAIPTLLEFDFPLWHAIGITVMAMVIYTVIAFFFRPEPDTDNMGLGGGLMNDPFQRSDNTNRFLWKLSCCLAPGRFTAETFLDLCVFVGLFGGGQAATPAPTASTAAAATPVGVGSFDATRPIAPLDPNRFAQSSAHFVAEKIQLDTQRFLNSSLSAADNQPAKV
jgi:hypothetical protein